MRSLARLSSIFVVLLAGAALGYALAALVFLLAKFITVPRAEDEVA